MNKGWCLVLACLAAAAVPSMTACGPPSVGAVPTNPSEDSPVVVDVLTPTKAAVQSSTTQPATVHAWFEAREYAKASGYLAELNVDIGQSVKKDEVLAVIAVPEMAKQREAKLATIRQMEASQRRAAAEVAVTKANAQSFEAKLAQAKAEVGRAEAALNGARMERDRVTELVKEKAVADRLLDEAHTKYEAAQAEKKAVEAGVVAAEAELALSRARTDAAEADAAVAQASTDVARRDLEELEELLKYCQLRAPFDGVVTERHVEPGDLVRNSQTSSSKDGTSLLVITRIDKVRVRVAVPERDAPLADVGDKAQITLQAIPGRTLEGQVSRVAGVLDPQTRTMLVEIDLPNPDGKLRPGMFGQATIALEPPVERLTLPAAAVRHDEQGKSYVYVVNDASKIQVVDVQTGVDDGRQIEITAGLKGGERIVAAMIARLKPEQLVRVKGP